MGDPRYQSGDEVHVGDRVSHAGHPGVVGFVVDRDEYSPEFPREQWQETAAAHGGGVMIRQDHDGDLFLYGTLEDEEDIDFLGRGGQ
jgi:hypothetical protein